MIYLPITSFESIFDDIIQWIKQYFNHLNVQFDANKSQNDGKYLSHGNGECTTIDFILRYIVIIIGRIYFIYALIDCLLFQNMILAHYCIKIIIISTVLSIIIYIITIKH